jgi:hypothetical protein
MSQLTYKQLTTLLDKLVNQGVLYHANKELMRTNMLSTLQAELPHMDEGCWERGCFGIDGFKENATYWYYDKDGKLYSSNEVKLRISSTDNSLHFGAVPQHVKDLHGLLPLSIKREWVDLTEDELVQIGVATGLERAAVEMISSMLKELNT